MMLRRRYHCKLVHLNRWRTLLTTNAWLRFHFQSASLLVFSFHLFLEFHSRIVSKPIPSDSLLSFISNFLFEPFEVFKSFLHSLISLLTLHISSHPITFPSLLDLDTCIPSPLLYQLVGDKDQPSFFEPSLDLPGCLLQFLLMFQELSSLLLFPKHDPLNSGGCSILSLSTDLLF